MQSLDKDLDKIEMSPKEFEKLVIESANDKSWCELNGINYINPNLSELREKLYQELLSYKK